MARLIASLAVAAALVAGGGGPASAAVVPALDAGSVSDSFGVNTHLTYQQGPYADLTGVVGALRTLGVRHVRDALHVSGDGDGRRLNQIFQYLQDTDGVLLLL